MLSSATPDFKDSTVAKRTGIMTYYSDHTAQAFQRTSTRRAFLNTVIKSSAVLAGASLAGRTLAAQVPSALPAVSVYKDPNCGCCREWVKHMQKAGFAVTVHDTPDMDGLKASVGLPTALKSCHTAVIGTYLVEGHVPADVVQKFLAEKPAARGLAVPGMPSGSPGMEGGAKDKYDVLLFDKAGKSRVYASR